MSIERVPVVDTTNSSVVSVNIVDLLVRKIELNAMINIKAIQSEIKPAMQTIVAVLNSVNLTDARENAIETCCGVRPMAEYELADGFDRLLYPRLLCVKSGYAALNLSRPLTYVIDNSNIEIPRPLDFKDAQHLILTAFKRTFEKKCSVDEYPVLEVANARVLSNGCYVTTHVQSEHVVPPVLNVELYRSNYYVVPIEEYVEERVTDLVLDWRRHA